MIWKLEKPENDVNHILTYSKGSPEREKLLKEIEKQKANPKEIFMVINGRKIKSDRSLEIKCPHNHDLTLGTAYYATPEQINEAINSSLEAHKKWSKMDWYHRIAIFERAADLLSGPKRIENIAAIMLNLSKTPYEAEIDLAELVDFWRFNAYFARKIFERQPDQYAGESNRFDWRPLEGFIVAVPPFNFYSIAGNLPTAPAMVGNVALWKPASSVLYANSFIMDILVESGLPEGVINFLPFKHEDSDLIFKHKDFTGLHFTGSYNTLTAFWTKFGENIREYKNFPRIIGETGGKDFIFIHESADIRHAAINILRGGFEYGGQKCSACSRVYVPKNRWSKLKEILLEEIPKIKYGPTEDLSNFLGALINEKAYNKVLSYIDYARSHPDEYEIIYGGESSSEKGWFIQPTLVLSKKPKGKLIEEEIFGPIVTIYIYDSTKYEETLKICDETSPYGLTGSIFAKDRYAITKAEQILRYSAGNFYINDKPTGAIVGRQPFGGARASGTDDKAGSELNIYRWLLPRTIKETHLPSYDWKRNFML